MGWINRLMAGCLATLLLLPGVVMAENDNGDRPRTQPGEVIIVEGVSCAEGYIAQGNDCVLDPNSGGPPPITPPPPPPPPPPIPPGGGGGGDTDDDEDDVECPRGTRWDELTKNECSACGGAWDRQSGLGCAGGAVGVVAGTTTLLLSAATGGSAALVLLVVGSFESFGGTLSAMASCAYECKPVTPRLWSDHG